MQTIADRLNKLLIENDMSLGKLGRELGVSVPRLSAIKTGRVESPRLIREIARALGVTPGWLMFGEGEKEARQEISSKQRLLLDLFDDLLDDQQNESLHDIEKKALHNRKIKDHIMAKNGIVEISRVKKDWRCGDQERRGEDRRKSERRAKKD